MSFGIILAGDVINSTTAGQGAGWRVQGTEQRSRERSGFSGPRSGKTRVSTAAAVSSEEQRSACSLQRAGKAQFPEQGLQQDSSAAAVSSASSRQGSGQGSVVSEQGSEQRSGFSVERSEKALRQGSSAAAVWAGGVRAGS